MEPCTEIHPLSPAGPASGYPDCRILSIAIVTHNRKEKLLGLLDSILECRQVIPLLARIIIIDDSPGRTEIRFDIPGIIDYVWIPERIFITRAKNIAWRRANTPLILFIDDDNVVEDNAIMHLMDIMEKHPEIGAVMPSVSYCSQPSRIWVYATPFGRGAWSMALVGRNSLEHEIPGNDLTDTDALPNAFLIRRAVLASISGFDENFLYNNSCDLCQRIKGAGYSVYASKRSRFYHDVPPPGSKGYWADHVSADPDRAFPESRDWTLLMRKLHGGRTTLLPLFYIHFSSWVLQVDLGMFLMGLSLKRFLLINFNFFRGFLAGAKVSVSSYYGRH
jgi:GT2 family glycosyltransferase